MTALPLNAGADPVVALLAHRPFAWFTDVDGTLSPIVERPDEATVPPRLRDLLGRLARRIDCLTVISGRTAAHARDMVGVPEAVYAGNHGLARLENGVERVAPDAEPYVARASAAEAQLRARLSLPGIVFENKGPILAVHYRQAADPEEAKALIMRATDETSVAHGLALHEGRKVIELRPPFSRDKGTAVREIVGERCIRAGVYIGDDLTDIAAFRALRALREGSGIEALSIAVAAPEVDARVLREADYWVDGVADVERLLTAVVAALEAGDRR